LTLNAVLASVAGFGMALGVLPHTMEHPLLAHRAAAGELAGAFIFAFVARRLADDPSLIGPPLVFVLLQALDSAYDLAIGRDLGDLPPLVVEGTFALIYLVFAISNAKARPPASDHIAVASTAKTS
jgi:hypothetical protein